MTAEAFIADARFIATCVTGYWPNIEDVIDRSNPDASPILAAAKRVQAWKRAEAIVDDDTPYTVPVQFGQVVSDLQEVTLTPAQLRSGMMRLDMLPNAPCCWIDGLQHLDARAAACDAMDEHDMVRIKRDDLRRLLDDRDRLAQKAEVARG